jgi:hypothetical protein
VSVHNAFLTPALRRRRRRARIALAALTLLFLGACLIVQVDKNAGPVFGPGVHPLGAIVVDVLSIVVMICASCVAVLGIAWLIITAFGSQR